MKYQNIVCKKYSDKQSFYIEKEIHHIPGSAHFTVTPYMLCNTPKTGLQLYSFVFFNKSPDFVAKF